MNTKRFFASMIKNLTKLPQVLLRELQYMIWKQSWLKLSWFCKSCTYVNQPMNEVISSASHDQILVSKFCCSIALSHKTSTGKRHSTAVDRRQLPAQPTSSPPSNQSTSSCYLLKWIGI
ncbi:uncharacterized protein LOC133869625 [Alnus glutinosa]|uniref:uncharacterized protein LOC133869625 n=1 Tax=Alnus glutinosa TaxID=3517 RepID=UPI002D79569F|nr:uncharacterized protein LOC133869625 [Alnus glutinosa]